MKNTKTIIVILFTLLCQTISATIEIRSTHLTTNEGLANNSIRYIYQDKKGFMWFGTLNGLNRYDGYSFLTIRPERGAKLSLADHRITDLQEDKKGFLWISTSAELVSCFDLKQDCFVDFTGCGEYEQPYSNRFIDSKGNVWLWQDGNGCRKITYANDKFTSITFKKENNNLFSNKVKYVFEDTKGRIWIGTQDGIALVKNDKCYKKSGKHDARKIISYKGDVFFLSVSGDILASLGGNKDENLVKVGSCGGGVTVSGEFRLNEDWIIFTNNGSYQFNLKTHELKKYRDIDIKGGQTIIDNKGNLWVFNHSGKVWYVNHKTKQIKSFQLIPADKVNYIDQERYHIIHDSRDIIWISTYGNGLFAYDLSNDELQHFVSNNTGFSHIPSNFLQYVMEDRAGGIWVSSEYTGISHLSVLNEGARRIFPEDESLLDRSNAVRMLVSMPNNRIMLGTRRGGLYTYDSKFQKMESKQSFDSNIYSAAQGPDGKMWLGSRGNGLEIDGKWYKNNSYDPTSISNNNIFSIYKDRKGRMWIGTFGGGLDLAVKDKNGYHFKHFFNKTYSQKQIRTIQEDKSGWLWVGTSDGLYVFNPDSLIASEKNYYTYNYNNNKMYSNEIKCIYKDSKGRMWIGASGKGFCVCMPNGDYNNPKFKSYDVANGLISNMVQAIVEDSRGKIWISTEYGISCFDPTNESFENFFFSSFTLGNVYSENSGCISGDGNLLFGTNHGLVILSTDKVNKKKIFDPKVEFTNLRINGILMRPGDSDSPLKKALIYSDELQLKYYQNSFEVNFSTFDYFGNNSAKYTYKLENFDSEWSKPSSLNFAVYKNLSPGIYKLRVKACNVVGKWAEKEAVINIVILPPYWKTNWAFIIYAILIIAFLYITFRLVNNFNSLRNKIQVEKHISEYKLVFFTNISHEFRTPLTLIQGALERIEQSSEKVPKDMKSSIDIMDKSTQRMLRLINQLLVFRKIENNKFSLSLEEIDAISFLHEIFQSFKDAAWAKKMDYSFSSDLKSYKMFTDKGSLDKITYNLLSNSFKYTPSGGRVNMSISVNEVEKNITIRVSDNGVGIPNEKRDELFKRFAHSSYSGGSIGVGLNLAHGLVMALKGTITYNDNDGGGSLFTVTLPTDPTVYDPNDFLVPNNILLEEESHNQAVLAEEKEPENHEEKEICQQPINKHKILIIEDDNDVRTFLKDEIGQYFDVIAEADGESGYERARSYDADLIICDVLMPGMNGFEVTKKLKNDFSTSHIPIILLTAMSTTENQIEGAESGADVYITKPFSTKLLLTRIFKLIEQRDKLREKFSNDPNTIRPSLCTSDKDKQFADRLQEIMESQIDNAEFTVDEFASMVGLGRTVFYRKVRGVTGYSPNEYIRVVRLKKAAELLMSHNYNVAEVSYKVGINDPFYFSKCFKQQFGVAPSVYIRGKEDIQDNNQINNKEE